ncbi:heptosyltransferase family protein [Aquitalea magnusonii]|uniref:Heptosyltransferase family protein n=1 Tax=Aquitalea magnusonii TaxID=332411 RepID=A0A3G9GR72_9NEIS|nr:glycosyltransferase family 9 protein [Aquitalea magnusonii]BBF87126.1 heptosyltransferase family protein [Aquitalea magnusonii]
MKKQRRLPGRLLIFAALMCRLPWQWLRRRPSEQTVQRILVLHQFLLGDALMATSLLAKLRERYPVAEITLACPPGQVGLYQSRPYGITAVGWHPRDFASVRKLFAMPRFDLVFLSGENRLSFLARAIGARWIIGFAAEAPAYKNWLVDEAVAYSDQPESWTDTAARLVAGPEPKAFDLADWPVEVINPVSIAQPYVVLHVGASSATRYWPTTNWQDLAAGLRMQGRCIVWSCGPGEEQLIGAIDPPAQDIVMAGCLNLVQLRALLHGAQACICPDTGVAHLAKTAGVPLLMLFGPGSEILFGRSNFFSAIPCVGVGAAWFPCRIQRDMHHRQVSWALRCHRTVGDKPDQCHKPQCMAAVQPSMVLQALVQLLP